MPSRPVRVAASRVKAPSPVEEAATQEPGAETARHAATRVVSHALDARSATAAGRRRAASVVSATTAPVARAEFVADPVAPTPVTPLRDHHRVHEPFALPAERRGEWRLVAKRVVDVVGALVGLLLAAPIVVLLAPLIRWDSAGGVFFAQSRIGRGGRPFRCYKLRTMRVDAEDVLRRDHTLRSVYVRNGFKVPAQADHRVTALGRFLRTTSLDEVPQFWNVLRGDMSLVGPRPIVSRELAHYGPEQATLLAMKPGLTGAWAVRGRSRIGYPQRATIELEYVRTWSLRGDIVILARTLGVVVQRRGAY
jgi:exopolysaccharide production protein ExoY